MTDAHDEHSHGKLRDKASHAIESSRDRARDAAERASNVIDTNPIGMIVGGLAVGALAAALVPRGHRERELLAPMGRRVKSTAAAAFAAAKGAGQTELASLGISREAVREQAKSLFAGLAKAASSASSAAAKASKEAGGKEAEGKEEKEA